MKIIAYDMGTGGMKASLYDEELHTLAKYFVEYNTYYPKNHYHEQRVEDWWSAMITTTKNLLSITNSSAEEISCIALSGHSLVALPVDYNGKALIDQVPIWSDTRAQAQANQFFKNINYDRWYMTTGNGFPTACYSLFKIMWYKENMPDLYEKTHKFIGSKDFINARLTGTICTDHSYASGSGAYDLINKKMDLDFINAAGLTIDKFPDIVTPHHIVGNLIESSAKTLGLNEHTLVACGGVDNACMALGAVGAQEGKAYTSLGSSSWIPINSRKPILDIKMKPYVFAHIQEDLFTSAFSIFAGGSSLKWAKETLCKDFSDSENVYDLITNAAKKSPIGSNNIFFNPSLAGGTSQDKSVNIRGSFIGLHLGTTRNDMLRAIMEGVALSLGNSIQYLKENTNIEHDILFCGGGSQSQFWLQMFADVFNMNTMKSSIDQDAASIGAAAIAARAIKIWDDYKKIPSLHKLESINQPNQTNVTTYKELRAKFNHISHKLSDIGDYLSNNH